MAMLNTMKPPRRGKRQGGSEVIEFSLIILFLIPFLLVSFTTGMNLIRANQCTAVARDIGNMYIHGVDFSQSVNKDLAVRLAHGLNLQNSSTSGDGVIILSQVTFIGDATCTANNLSGAACVNRNQYVFTMRLTIGNTSLRSSSLGAPTATINSGGYVQNFLTDTGARVGASFSPLWNPPLADGQLVYASEAFFNSVTLNGVTSPGGGVYARNFF
jgi:hypothetical protein